MKKRITKFSLMFLALALLAIPTLLFGQKLSILFRRPKKQCFTELETEGEEMDLNGSKINKEEYLQNAMSKLAFMRGLPIPKGDERTKAIRKMEDQKEFDWKFFYRLEIGSILVLRRFLLQFQPADEFQPSQFIQLILILFMLEQHKADFIAV